MGEIDKWLKKRGFCSDFIKHAPFIKDLMSGYAAYEIKKLHKELLDLRDILNSTIKRSEEI